jgi:hypothetical protein
MNFRTVFFLIVSTAFQQLSAQQYSYIKFPDDNEVWVQQLHFVDSVANLNVIVTNEDTIIHEQTYKKVFVFNSSVFLPSTATFLGGIREDSLKRVFYIGKSILYKMPAAGNDSAEILLYNFSVNVGDTLQVEDYPNLIDDSLVVRSIDTIILGNQTRRLIKIGLPIADFPEERFNYVTWLEGVGKLNNFYCDYGGLLSGNLDRIQIDLSRFSLHFLTHGGDTIYTSPYNSRCYGYVGLFKPEVGIINSTIFPNPTTNQFTISVTTSTIKTVKIYNLTGQLVLEQKLSNTNQNQVSIDASFLKTGLYQCVVELANGSTSTQRLIKE